MKDIEWWYGKIKYYYSFEILVKSKSNIFQ